MHKIKTPQALRAAAFVASLGRFELPAFRLGGERSIQLSYRDIYKICFGRPCLCFQNDSCGKALGRGCFGIYKTQKQRVL